MVGSAAYFYSPKGCLFIGGEDSATFLQGQFSQDLRIPDKEAAYGLWLNSKGKILGDSFVLKMSDHRFLAISYATKTEFIRDNLDSRVIMDEVETRPAGSGWQGVSLWGDSIGAVLDQFELDEPNEGGFSSNDSVYVFWGHRGGGRNLEVIVGNNELVEIVKNALGNLDVQILDTGSVGLAAMKSDRFELFRDILRSDLPQEVGLGDSAVSYQKGCYLGQEVMARLKSMGRARRELECVSVSRVPEGEGPWSLLDVEGRRVGELRRVIEDGERFVGSAMLKRSRPDGSSSVDGQADVIVRDLLREGEIKEGETKG